jgi:hypothetical protein
LICIPEFPESVEKCDTIFQKIVSFWPVCKRIFYIARCAFYPKMVDLIAGSTLLSLEMPWTPGRSSGAAGSPGYGGLAWKRQG